MSNIGGRKDGRFWKSVGGYIYCVTVRGRWYFVGYTYAEARPLMERWFASMKAAGIQTMRVGAPTTVERLFAKHGNCPAALIDHMPHYADIVENEKVRSK